MIRQAKVADAQQIIKLAEQLAHETDFMLREVGEEVLSLAAQEALLSDFIAHGNKVFFVLEKQDQIVGLCVGSGGFARRNKHNLYCVMGILQSHTGQGFGRALLNQLEEWAKAAEFTRLELTVMMHNDIARRLYLSFGFEEEGIKRRSLYIKGQYVDEVYMSKLL